MKNSTLFVLVGILVFMGLILLVFRQISSPEKPRTVADADLAEQAVRFEISRRNAGEFVFTRMGLSWRMESPVSYPADSTAIKSIIDKLSRTRLSDSLSSEPSRYELFGLGASSRTRVRIFTGGEALSSFRAGDDRGLPRASAGLDFYAGKEGTEINSFYLKFADKKEVMQASGLPLLSFSKSLSEWLEKTIIDVPPEKISGISVKSADGGFEILRSSSGWNLKLSGGKTPALQALSTSTVLETVTPMLQRLAGLKADKVIPGKAENIVGPDMTITISPTGKAQISLKVGKTKDTTRRCIEKSGEKRVYFLLGDWKLSAFKNALKTLGH